MSGHVDGLATVLRVTPIGETTRFDIAAPERLARFIAEKGSVALDGTSLTVNSVAGRTFSVLLIPHTLAVTTWGEVREGDALNLEIDTMARYAARLAEFSGRDARGRRRRRGAGLVSDRYPVLARYNAWANHKLYRAVEALPDAEFRADRGVFFKSLRGTLNHILAADRIWMARFTGVKPGPLRLDTILNDDFESLHAARQAEDTRIIGYVDGLDAAALAETFTYQRTTSLETLRRRTRARARPPLQPPDPPSRQAHAVLTGLGAEAPALDLALFYAEVGHGGLVRIA